jgi:hypothetical protein
MQRSFGRYGPNLCEQVGDPTPSAPARAQSWRRPTFWRPASTLAIDGRLI